MKALLLEGGGAKGAYEAGAIMLLNKRNMEFDLVGGTSIGAINAACYVSKNCKALYKIWLTTDTEELFGIDPQLISKFENNKFNRDDIKEALSIVKKIIKNKGLETSKMRSVLEKNISEEKFRRNKLDFAMNTFSLSKLKPVEVFKDDIPEGKLIEYIMSSAYLPVFKFERIIDNSYYIDGGMYSNCPVDMVINKGYDEIYVIKAWQSKLKYKKNKNVKVHIITPRENLGSIMSFDKERAEYRMNLGYYDMMKYLDNLDGDKYYLKSYNEEYYTKLFSKSDYNKIIKKHNKGSLPKSNKEFIIKTLEKICKEQNLERFRVYNTPYLISKLKYRLAGKINNNYYDFIKMIKVDFEK